MRLLITFCLIGVALGGLADRLRELTRNGGRSGRRGGGGGGGAGSILQSMFGGSSCSCDDQPGPSGDCFDQMQDVKECVKGVFQDEGPSRAERREMKAQVKALKRDILDDCFDSPCVDPREAMREFGECMEPTVMGRRGILPQFQRCMADEGVEIPEEMREKMMDKARKMFNKLMKNGASDEEDSDDDEDMGKGMMMMMKGGKALDKKREMLEKLVGAVCPTQRSANRASQCIEDKINRSGLNKGSSRRSPNPLAMLGKLSQAKPCSCRVSQECKDDVEDGMKAVCSCKDSQLTRNVRNQLERQARRCARRAGINTEGFGDIIEKVKSKMSKMCDGNKMEKMKSMMNCS